MGRPVPAVTRALDVLELFHHGDGTLFAPEVTRKFQLPRTTVHELLTTLAARSCPVPVADQPGRHCPGVRTYQLGSRYAEQLDLAAEDRQVAREVAGTCGETVQVAILDDTDTDTDTDIVCVAEADTDEDELRTVLASVRERGVAVERRESDPDVSCVAAPVRDRTGSVVAALSISVPMIRWAEEREEEPASLAVGGADALSGRLGHHEGQQ
ncbi:IclR family transcriptional regulator [Streptomyces atratus]|uniref:IclR family transcriptional regulator n=1 Tax=Streptomyces atratus TaxID=1893 RepID=A0A2Z5JLE0_STRAR|nr:IclR family transcriptional regulator C-terminal domain-containing protein [Streptomyces atratus]AXE81228.1 IclR family transcriptional regulator [Streptomyces atratus]